MLGLFQSTAVRPNMFLQFLSNLVFLGSSCFSTMVCKLTCLMTQKVGFVENEPWKTAQSTTIKQILNSSVLRRIESMNYYFLSAHTMRSCLVCHFLFSGPVIALCVVCLCKLLILVNKRWLSIRHLCFSSIAIF